MRFGDKPKENKLAKLYIYKNLFNGRNDVFARRWEKGKKAGYMPAYDYDRNKYWLHKNDGGTFDEFKEKKLIPALKLIECRTIFVEPVDLDISEG